MRSAKRPIARRTIEPRIPISRSDVENEPWRNSGAQNRYRSSFRSKLRSTIILIKNVTSTATISSKITEHPRLRRGGNLPRETTSGSTCWDRFFPDNIPVRINLTPPLKHIPAGRYGSLEEMAKLALFLASDAASYVVGETLIADSGYVLL